MPRDHYNTRQRERILELLAQAEGEHVTVACLEEQLRERGEKVGRTTIYRYLEELTAQGLARRYVPVPGGSTCYQYMGGGTCCEHYHMQCLACGRLFHVACEYMDAAAAHVRASHGFELDGGRTVLVGLCRECAKSAKGEGGGERDGADDAAKRDAEL